MKSNENEKKEGKKEEIIYDPSEVVELSDKMDVRNNVAIVHNKLIEARHKYTLDEIKLMDALISFVQPNDSDLKVYKIPVSIFKLLMDDRSDVYSVVKRAAYGLLSKPLKVEIVNEKGKRVFEAFNFVSYVKYIEGEANLIVAIDKHFKSYLIGLKEFFSKIPIRFTYLLSSKHSVMLYRLLKQYENTGFRIDYIQDLRSFIGVEPNEYKRFPDFEKRVLKKAVEEINKKTDLEVSYKKKKTGRKVTHIEFYVKVKPDAAKEREIEKKIIEEVRRLNQGDTTETTKTPSQVVDNKEQKQEKNKGSVEETKEVKKEINAKKDKDGRAKKERKEKKLEKVWNEIGKVRKKYEKVLNELINVKGVGRLNENQILFLLANLNEDNIPVGVAKEIIITADKNKSIKNPMGFLIRNFDIDMSKARFKELTLTSRKIDEKLLKEKLEKMMIDGTSAIDYIRAYWNEEIKPKYNSGELNKTVLKLLKEPLQKAVIDDIENKIYVIVPDIAYRDWLDSEFGDDMRKFFKERFDIDDVVVESLEG